MQKHCNNCNSTFTGNPDIIQERCPKCRDNETVPINPPCPYCGEELETIDALASIGSTLMWCGVCHYFITEEDAEIEGLTSENKSV